MQPRSRRVPGVSGLDLHLLEWSEQGVPLLCLHGFGNDAHIWDDFAPAVAPYYRTLALDHRGHGDSAWDPERRYDHDTMVEDVELASAALGVERLVIVGHSLGGRIATLFAGRHPERMAGLVLVDIGPDLDARGVLRIRMEVESSQEPVFGSVEEYGRLLSLHYPAAQPKALLAAIPGLRVVPLKEADWCCGSAGIYNVTHPDLSRELLDRKMAHVAAAGADLLVTANPGCLMQLRAGARSAGLRTEVVHVVDLLDRAYAAGE